ncbi:MAG: hypothetical protein F4Y46_00735 [Chloroflexi bacterium]|nr:hypothetical protein [Chloroflexota bacterium]
MAEPRRLMPRRRLLGAAGSFAALLAACGSGADGSLPPLNDQQREILDSVGAISSDQIELVADYLADQTVKLGYVQSPWGGRNEHYRNLAIGANSWQEIYPRIRDDRVLINQAEGLGVAETLSTLSNEARPDLLLFPGRDLAELNRAGLLIELDKAGGVESLLRPGEYWGRTLAAGSLRGRQLAIPLMLGPWMMMCQLDLLSTVGVDPPIDRPWDSGPFMTNLARLTNPASHPTERGAFGFMQLVSTNANSDSMPPSWIWMLAMGADLPGLDDGEERLQSAEALAAYELIYALVHDQRSAIKFDGVGGRSLRNTLFENANAMVSYPFNSGWLSQFWRGREEPVSLAHLPAGPGHYTPVEMHMMLGVLTSARDQEAAIASMQAIARTAGDSVFPTARRSDVNKITALQPRITREDVDFMDQALSEAEPVMLPGQERSIMRRNIDLPLMVGRENPESAASAAFAALSEHRFNRGQ